MKKLNVNIHEGNYLKLYFLKVEREDDNYNTGVKGIFISNLQAGILSVFFQDWMVMHWHWIGT